MARCEWFGHRLFSYLVVSLIGITACSGKNQPSDAHGRAEAEVAVARLVAAGGGDVDVRRSRMTGLPRFVAGKNGRGFSVAASKSAPAEQRAHAFLTEHGAAFGFGNRPEVRLVRTVPRDQVGQEHVVLQQIHRGIPVTGAEWMVHLKGDHVVATNGRVIDATELDSLNVSPSVQEAEAAEIAGALVRNQYGVTPTLTTPQLEVFNHGVFNDSRAPSRLAWFVEAHAPRILESIWVDAQDGAVLLHFNEVRHALQRDIYNSQHRDPAFYPPPLGLVRSEGQPPIGDADVDVLYDNFKRAYDYFLNRYNRDSYDGAGITLIGITHAFAESNAGWDPLTEYFEFGDDMPGLDDLVTHEFAHAVLEHTAKLFPYQEAGALAESFADIMGESADLQNGFGNDSPEVRWLLGEDLVSSPPIRNMMDPAEYGMPGRSGDPLYWCDYGDGYGIHFNSGVSSHAYALMTDGGAYNGHTIRGIGLAKSEQVAFRAMTTHLTRTSGFKEASDAFHQACADLIGTKGIVAEDCTQVDEALKAVEMPDGRPCNSTWVQIRKEGSGSGHVTMLRAGDPSGEQLLCEPAGTCDAYLVEGTTLQLEALADSGSVFAGWRGICADDLSACSAYVTGDTMNIVAVFEPVGTTRPVTVTIGASAPGARVTSDPAGIDCGADCSEVIPVGTLLTLSASTASGYGVARWGGACSGVGPTCQITVSGSMSVSVDFGPLPFQLAASLGSSFNAQGAAWGDYDGDGDLDLAVVGTGSSVLYRNDGGTLVDSGTTLVTLGGEIAVAWGDYDNDGALDLAIGGHDTQGNPVLVIYHNNSGVLADSGMTFPGIGNTRTLVWGDYDGDGDLDLVVSGVPEWRPPSTPARILRNDSGVLVDSGQTALPPAQDVKWGDYDGDGDLDLVAALLTATKLYRNDSGLLVDSGMKLNTNGPQRAAWADYDNDGRLDLAVASSPFTKLYQNQDGELIDTGAELKSSWDLSWGDANGDGTSDLLIFGMEEGFTFQFASLFERESGDDFSEVATGLPTLSERAVWGDFDNDGRLDLYLFWANAVYRNVAGASNTPPQPPTSTSVVATADGVRLVWRSGSDAATPRAGLSYNVRVGTTPNGSELVSAMADPATGRRFVPAMGNAGLNHFFTLRNLPPGRYYWTVQSIDTSFAGSAFTATGTFDYPPTVVAKVAMTDDRGTSYCADLTVTNISASTVNGWQTTFVLPGGNAVNITSLSNFQYTRNGTVVTLQPGAANSTLAPGQSATGRLCASGPSGNEYPLQVTKNGAGDGSVSANPVGIECGVDCSATYPGGTSVTLTATAAVGSKFTGWGGACSGTGNCTVTIGPAGASVTATFVPDATGGVTVTPTVAQNTPYYNEEQVRIDNSSALTALSITIAIQKTTGITYNGQFNTVGNQIVQSHTSSATAITYRFSLASGQTLASGTGRVFAAQTNGTGTPHPTAGDTYSVTYTTINGQTYTQNGHF